MKHSENGRPLLTWSVVSCIALALALTMVLLTTGCDSMYSANDVGMRAAKAPALGAGESDHIDAIRRMEVGITHSPEELDWVEALHTR